MPTVETIQVSKREYEQLLKDQLWLQCLEEAGVDNWQGFDEARNIWREYENQE